MSNPPPSPSSRSGLSQEVPGLCSRSDILCSDIVEREVDSLAASRAEFWPQQVFDIVTHEPSRVQILVLTHCRHVIDQRWTYWTDCLVNRESEFDIKMIGRCESRREIFARGRSAK